MKQGNGKCEHNIPLIEDNKCFLTWLLMLETASLQPSSSLVLLKISVFPLVSSGVFLASAGLQEADTLVLITKENRSFQISCGFTISSYLDIARLLPAFPPSDKRLRCFLADWGVPPVCTPRPPPAPPFPCTRPPPLFTCWPGEACWRRLGVDPGEGGGVYKRCRQI